MTDPWEELTTKQATIIQKAICDHVDNNDGKITYCPNYNENVDHRGMLVIHSTVPEEKKWAYASENDTHFCPEHKKLHCIDTDEKEGCGERLNKYNKCDWCDDTEENIEKDYKDAWGLKKAYRSADLILFLSDGLIECPECIEKANPGKDIEKDDVYSSYDHKTRMTPIYDHHIGGNEATYCHNCFEHIYGNNTCEKCYDDWSGGDTAWSNEEQMYLCPTCDDKRCSECYDYKGKYNQCPNCYGSDKKYEKDYKDAWGLKKAIVQARIICDHDGCDNKYFGKRTFGLGIGRLDELPDSWGKATAWNEDPDDDQALWAEHHFCPEHKDLHCIDEENAEGCGRELCSNGTCGSWRCQFRDMDRRQQRRDEQRYIDAWGLKKKASDNSFVCDSCLVDIPIDQMNKYNNGVFCNDCYKQTKKREQQRYIDAWGFGKKASTFHHCDHQDQTGTCKNISQYDDEDELYNWRSDSFYDTKHNMVHIGNDRHYCPEHKNLYCRQCDIPMQKEDIADGYTECFNCHNCNDNKGKYGQCQRCIDNEEVEQEYSDAWGLKKKALNYFSLDQPNEAIMPGMAQNEPNPDSGMEDNVTQDFPGMHDYERGLSAAASIKQSYEDYDINDNEVVCCDLCNRSYGGDSDEFTDNAEEADRPNLKNIKNISVADYGWHNFYVKKCKSFGNEWVHVCPSCINSGDACKEFGHKPFGKIGKYGQCTICKGSDKNIEQDYSDAWGFDKKSSFEKVIFCDECGKHNPNLDEYTPRGWGRASLNGFPLESRDAIYLDPKNVPSEYNSIDERHYCPDCKEGRHLDENIHDPGKMTFGCGDEIGQYGQCTSCDGEDEDIENEYKDSWGLKKKASFISLIECDNCFQQYNKFPYMNKLDRSGNAVKDGWKTYQNGYNHHCPSCIDNNKHYDKWNEDFYFLSKAGCGNLLGKYGNCNGCGKKDKDIEQEYSDSWGFDKQGSSYFDPIAYVYDADIHCPKCAEYASKNLDNAKDSEGNPVGVIFNDNDWEYYDKYCGTCTDPIVKLHCDECGEYKPGAEVADNPNNTYSYICNDCLGEHHKMDKVTWCNKCGNCGPHYKDDEVCVGCTEKHHEEGSYGKCTTCYGSDEQQYKDAGGLKKKGSQSLLAMRSIPCENDLSGGKEKCDNTLQIHVGDRVVKKLIANNWSIQAGHIVCPEHSSGRCSKCGWKIDDEHNLCPQCDHETVDYMRAWNLKKAMWDEDNYHFRCDECLKIGGVEGEENKAIKNGWKMDYGSQYCPKCWEHKICHDCWNPKLDTSYNQCKYCDGDDEEYKENYKNAWGL